MGGCGCGGKIESGGRCACGGSCGVRSPPPRAKRSTGVRPAALRPAHADPHLGLLRRLAVASGQVRPAAGVASRPGSLGTALRAGGASNGTRLTPPTEGWCGDSGASPQRGGAVGAPGGLGLSPGRGPAPLRSTLLRPGFDLPVPADGNYAPLHAEALAQVRAAARNLVVLDVPALTAHVDPSRPGVGLLPGRVPAVGPGGGQLDHMLSFWMRDQYFEVSARWYDGYLLDLAEAFGQDSDVAVGRVSSVEDTLASLWSAFWAEKQGNWDTFTSLLGCFNLPREAPEVPYLPVFWSGGQGPFFKVFRYSLQLIRTYWEEIAYHIGTEEGAHCDGFAPFVRDLLEGAYPERNSAGAPASCFVNFNYRNAESGWDRLNASCTLSSAKSECDVGFDPNANPRVSGYPWNNWTPVWQPDLNCWATNESPSSCRLPDGSLSENVAIGGDFNVTSLPVDLAYRGLVADYAMGLARMCQDYAYHLAEDGDFWGSLTQFETATRLARYALAAMVVHAKILIHEMGHTYAGDNHCEHDCCFEIGARRWLCRVNAHLGLPRQEFEPRISRILDPSSPLVFGDFDNPDGRAEDPCDSCGDSGTHFGWSCTIPVEGVVGEEGTFGANTAWNGTGRGAPPRVGTPDGRKVGTISCPSGKSGTHET